MSITKSKKKIKRIFQVDYDSERNPFVLLRIMVRAIAKPDGTIEAVEEVRDSDSDIIVLMEALLMCILYAEKSGDFKKGAAMKKAMEGLQRGYVNADIGVAEFEDKKSKKS